MLMSETQSASQFNFSDVSNLPEDNAEDDLATGALFYKCSSHIFLQQNNVL
jgi:hypothetical protein